MSVCEYCNKESKLLFICSHCGKRFCSSHRHPESHECKENEYHSDLFTDNEAQRLNDQKIHGENQEIQYNIIEDEILEENTPISIEEVAAIFDRQNDPLDDTSNSLLDINSQEILSLQSHEEKNEDMTVSDKIDSSPINKKEISGLNLALTQLNNVKLPLLFIIIISILAGAVMGTLTDLGSPQNNLQERYDALYKYFTDLQTQNQVLNQQLDEKSIQIDTLIIELNATKEELDDLQDKIDTIFSDSTKYVYPTTSQIRNWLEEDQTDKQLISQDYTALHQAIHLSLLGKARNWKIGVVNIYGDFNGTTRITYNIVAIEPDIFIYINPQTDNIWWTAYYDEIAPNQIWNIEHYSNVSIKQVDTILLP